VASMAGEHSRCASAGKQGRNRGNRRAARRCEQEGEAVLGVHLVAGEAADDVEDDDGDDFAVVNEEHGCPRPAPRNRLRAPDTHRSH